MLVLLAPLLIPLSWVVAKTTRWRSLHLALLFGYGFLFFEIAGVIALVWVGCRYRNHAALMKQSYVVQRWWAHGLYDLARRLFGLTFEVSGQEAIQGGGAILISRHTNIADNVFPLVFFGSVRNQPVRYILKKELQAIPTLDIGGNRLPNLFIDRSGLQTAAELEKVRDLLVTCDEDDSLLIYPEGTRFNADKQAAISRKTGMKEQADRWPSLLPPRLGGITAILEANPGKDAVFLCHNGFEGSGGFSDLLDGAWLNKAVGIHFWRVPYAEIGDDARSFIFTQWDQMEATLQEMRAE